ncbi:MAG: prolipoprotein diacylglyceryl transferase [Deltaproteobacteria bacterium]|nr:prolipoprotein diacylglyceryl transferase [Deltaproteobacteria bacterium]
MRPELFNLLDVSFPAYFVLLITGFTFATMVAVVHARRVGLDPDVIVDLALASLLLGVIGGRIFHVLFDGYFWDYVHLCTDPSKVDWPISKAACASERYRGVWDAAKGVCHPAERMCFRWAEFWAGGLVYYGGLVFATVGAIVLLKRDRFDIWKASDLSAPGISLGLGFGRIGCLLAGCCFGTPSDGPLALVFPRHSPASEAQAKAKLLANVNLPSLPVHPAQVYESLASFAIAAFCLVWMHGRKRYDGQVFLVFLGLYGLARFALEFLRADDRGAAGGLSTSQLISLALLVGALAVHRAKLARALAR